ncbi:ABC transporter substrate-binding protein [Mesoterricola sediminis]|uniref:Cobalamin ABC transporter substrate-binding protein n=1 Tax=Mesoterricola sediminis TaxID=2927980 RepID=A0AA48GPC8_9BACT|nr:ABC transporter substrate-binding protein [Mesoterricola sediminis]BDU75084.1 cobalamin ABC transporter substrate-binding protein [Mesoterricola sediminis]
MRFLALLLLAASLVAGAPRRVVSQTVGTDELLAALAAPGQVAALSHLARDPAFSPDVKGLSRHPCLRSGTAEDVLSFRPDLVLAATYTAPETLALLRRARVPLVVLDRFETLDDLYDACRRVGAALGRPARAEELIAQWRARVADLDRRLKGVRPVRVLAVGAYPFTAGLGTTFQDLCDHAGALNVAAEQGLRGHQPTPSEKLLTWNVECLVTDRNENMAARLRAMPPYKYMRAMKEGRLVEIPGPLMSATGQARLEAYEWLARALHPERFR